MCQVKHLLSRALPTRVVDGNEKLHDELRTLRLARATLAADHNALVDTVSLCRSECTRTDGKDVRRKRADELALVEANLLHAVDPHLFVRVDSHENRSRVPDVCVCVCVCVCVTLNACVKMYVCTLVCLVYSSEHMHAQDARVYELLVVPLRNVVQE